MHFKATLHTSCILLHTSLIFSLRSSPMHRPCSFLRGFWSFLLFPAFYCASCCFFLGSSVVVCLSGFLFVCFLLFCCSVFPFFLLLCFCLLVWLCVCRSAVVCSLFVLAFFGFVSVCVRSGSSPIWSSLYVRFLCIFALVPVLLHVALICVSCFCASG